MSNVPELLLVDTRNFIVYLGETPLRLKRKWVYLYALLGLVFGSGNPYVSRDDIKRLPSWSSNKRSSIGSSVWRHARTMAARGLPLIRSPEGKRSRLFALDPARVSEVSFDLPRAALRVWLGHDLPEHSARLSEADWWVLEKLNNADAYLERGRFAEAERELNDALAREPNPNERVRALTQLAWLEEHRGRPQAAREACRAALELAEQRRPVIAPRTHAYALLQCARLERMDKKYTQAQETLHWAAASLGREHPLLWSRIEAERGILASRTGHFERAEVHYLKALEYRLTLNWPYGVQMAYCNLGALYWRRYQAAKKAREAERRELLERAAHWFERSLAYTDRVRGQIGEDSVYGELMMACIRRLQGQLQQSAHYLALAQRILEATDNRFDTAQCLVEQAEHALLANDEARATQHLREAERLFLGLGFEGEAQQVAQRLRALAQDLFG